MTPIDMAIVGHVSKDIISIDRRERRETGGLHTSLPSRPSRPEYRFWLLQKYRFAITRCLMVFGRTGKELLIIEDGGVSVSDGNSRHFLAFHKYNIEARSGRGDTCFASYLSYGLNHSIEEDCISVKRSPIRNSVRQDHADQADEYRKTLPRRSSAFSP
jgi:hypothetical protein